MSNLVKHVESFISSEDLDVLISFARNNPEGFDEFGNAEKEFKVNILQSGEGVAEVRNILLRHDKQVEEYLKANYDTEFKTFKTHIHIAKFDEGSEMHVHFDSSRPDDIATIVYLNDDYEGGEIFFPDYDISIKPKAGDLVAFPDNENFRHGVNKITSGTRYTTPRWFTTEGIKG